MVQFNSSSDTDLTGNATLRMHGSDAAVVVANYKSLTSAKEKKDFIQSLNDVPFSEPYEASENVLFWLELHSKSARVTGLRNYAKKRLKNEIEKDALPENTPWVKPLATLHAIISDKETLIERDISPKSQVLLAKTALKTIGEKAADIANWVSNTAPLPGSPRKNTFKSLQKKPFVSFVETTKPFFDVLIQHGGKTQSDSKLQNKSVVSSLMGFYFDLAQKAAPEFEQGLSDKKFLPLFQELDTQKIRLAPETYLPFDTSNLVSEKQTDAESDYYRAKYLAYTQKKNVPASKVAAFWHNAVDYITRKNAERSMANTATILGVNKRALQTARDLKKDAKSSKTGITQRNLVHVLRSNFDLFYKRPDSHPNNAINDITYLQFQSEATDLVNKTTIRSVRKKHLLNSMTAHNTHLQERYQPATWNTLKEQAKKDMISTFDFGDLNRPSSEPRPKVSIIQKLVQTGQTMTNRLSDLNNWMVYKVMSSI